MENLYSRDSLGKVRIWRMEVKGDQYRTISGVEDGELVTSEYTTALGKNAGKANETSAAEQAQKEVDSRYKKQLKTGYYSSREEIDNAGSYIEPILAKGYKDYADKVDFTTGDWWGQTKFNGLRLIATKEGLRTRKGEVYISIPHIHECLIPFFKQYPDAVLDGECFNEAYRQQLNEIVKLARQSKNVTKEQLQRSRELIRFYVYDGYGFNDKLGEKAPYWQRKEWIDKNVTNGDFEFLSQVEDWKFTSKADMESRYSSLVELGHEGIILRNKDMPYEHKRSKNLLKWKPLDEEDYIIEDIHEGSGNWAGKVKTISVVSKDGKLRFDASLKGSMEDGMEFLANKEKWIGKLVEIKYNGLTGLGTPQFAIMDYKNCLKVDE